MAPNRAPRLSQLVDPAMALDLTAMGIPPPQARDQPGPPATAPHATEQRILSRETQLVGTDNPTDALSTRADDGAGFEIVPDRSTPIPTTPELLSQDELNYDLSREDSSDAEHEEEEQNSVGEAPVPADFEDDDGQLAPQQAPSPAVTQPPVVQPTVQPMPIPVLPTPGPSTTGAMGVSRGNHASAPMRGAGRGRGRGNHGGRSHGTGAFTRDEEVNLLSLPAGLTYEQMRAQHQTWLTANRPGVVRSRNSIRFHFDMLQREGATVNALTSRNMSWSQIKRADRG